MNHVTRFGSLGLGAVVLFAGLGHALGWWSGEDSGLFDHVRRLLSEAHRTEALSRRNEAVEDGLAQKRLIVAELRAGRLTLREAARRFAAINEGMDRGGSTLAGAYLKPTTREGVYRQVLLWVENEAGDLYPDEVRKILEPLEKEFQGLFGKPAREPDLCDCAACEADASAEESPVCELLE